MARMTTRQKESRKASRTKAQRKFWRTCKRYTVWSCTAVSLLVTVAGSWWLVDSGWVEKSLEEGRQSWHRTLAGAGFGLQQIYIQGREKTPQETVRAAIGLETGDSIFSISLEATRERIQQLGTVRHATVERMLPDTLFVTLEERVPVALWQHERTLYPIDRDGVVLKEDAGTYRDLIVVVGKGAPEHVAALLTLLEGHEALAQQVSAAVWVGGRRWNLTFRDGLEVMLPDTGADKALAKLAEMERTQGVLDKAVSAIDLRLHERIFITLPEQQSASPVPTSKEGASDI